MWDNLQGTNLPVLLTDCGSGSFVLEACLTCLKYESPVASCMSGTPGARRTRFPAGVEKEPYIRFINALFSSMKFSILSLKQNLHLIITDLITITIRSKVRLYLGTTHKGYVFPAVGQYNWKFLFTHGTPLMI